MDSKTCFIVGAGECFGLDFVPRPGDCVIGADGGLDYLEKSGLTADLAVGDFDSLARCPEHPNTLRLDSEKDETDTFAAVREGIKLGYKNFRLYCCTGGRIEHTIANIQLLAHLSQSGLKGFLVGRDSVITAVTDGRITFGADLRGYVSVFSHSEKSTGVFLKGLKYKLEDAVITNTFPLGISNEFIGSESVISVVKGTLLIVYPRAAFA
ncbi:MAG: thiamine diphosphokinase [Oscillospiraceae bacterium]|jgi:thiamine pyrophosphokinase|nr:thiamine diphosphokinase [Oscillospiraceae bacterium]